MTRHALFGFFWRFVLIYGLLIFPWPGWNDFYAGYFRDLGEMAFSRENDNRIVFFAPFSEQHGFSRLDTRMTLGNRSLADSSGNGRAEMLDLDSRSIGWVPTALTAALILATPLPWRRRVGALAGGMLLIHCFVLFSLQTWIWNASPSLSLSTLSPFWKNVVDDLEYTLVTQLGASFSVPLLIWVLVTFRRSDRNLLGRSA